VTIVRRPPGGGAVIQRECFIEGKDVDLPAVGKWRFTFALSDAASAADDVLIWDHPIQGLWDSGNWSW
jgi:hypothetical protein